MDGFNSSDWVIVIASTNLPESLDSSVQWSGRFDRVVEIPYPNW